MPYDPNDGSNPNICGAPWNEDDEGNCDCSGCRSRRHKIARDEYLADHGSDDIDMADMVDMAYENRLGWDELTEPQRRRRIESRIDAADFRRKEMKENAMIRSMEKGGRDGTT